MAGQRSSGEFVVAVIVAFVFGGGAVAAYNQTLGSLESRVLSSARRFRELGASAGEELPRLEPLERLPRSLLQGDGGLPFPMALHAVEDEAEESEAEPIGSVAPVPERRLRSGESA